MPLRLAVTVLSVAIHAGLALGQQAATSGGPHAAAVGDTLQNGPQNEVASSYREKSYAYSTESPDPQAILEDALRILQMRRSVAARIRQEIDLFGKRLVGSGNYLEQVQGRNRLVRLELKIQHDDQVSSLVQVAALPDSDDRRFLWTKRKVLDKEQLSRIDLDLVAQARAAQASETPDATSPRPIRMGLLQAEGGLGKILRGLHASFDFTDAQLGRLGEQGDLVWRLQGKWKPEQLARALGKKTKEGEVVASFESNDLPPHLPDRVVLHLRHEDLFPYRIEYRRTVSQTADGSSEPATQAMVTMEFYDVVVDQDISPHLFDYNPGDLEYSDDTAEYLDSLQTEP
ncbi:MAG TPA: hypothetical protein VE890_04160 [Thermoguttaceae bacterium]|nr:hypothetical protein [Thermoguttaceae bacterium]